MKKRFFLLLALTAALLLAFGMSTAMATEASPDDGHIHWAYCDNRGICAQCGAPYSGNIISHNWDGDYQYNETEHWKNCTVCGEELLRNNHSAMCDNPTVCSDCGVAYNGDDIRHFPNYEYNETEHWCICANCGEELYRGGHWAYCDDPTVCAYCGGPYSGDDIRHIWHDYQFNETEHWQVCTMCGEKGGQSEHWAWCDNPTVCAVCGQPYSGSNIEHDWSEYQHNETEHWTYCNKCGEEVNRSVHVAECDHPGVCYYCGASFSGDAAFHVVDDWQYSETEHWLICTLCGEETDRGEHWAKCDNPGVCAQCGAPYSGDDISHDWNWDNYQYNETECWQICNRCGEERYRFEHSAACDKPNVCDRCGQPYSGSNIGHYYNSDVGLQYQHDETNHWNVCTVCGEKYSVEAHAYGDDGVCTVCDYSKPTVTDAPTEAPTEVPTEIPTEAPTAVPTEKPTEVPTDVPTEAPTEAPTAVPTEVPTEAPTEVPTEVPTEAPTAVPTEAPTETPTEAPTDAPTTAPTAAPTKAPHQHVFRTFVSQGNGMHRSECETCGYGVIQDCVMEGRTVNGVPCEVCGVCGYTTVPKLTGIELPEEPMADASAVAAEGEAAPVLVYDLTSSLPEDSVFALCLQVVPQDGAAMPGDVQITVPCALDTANLRLVFIADGAQPVEVPFETGDGVLTFTAAAPGVYALTPVQE